MVTISKSNFVDILRNWKISGPYKSIYALMLGRGVHWKAKKKVQGRGESGYNQTNIHSEKKLFNH